MAGFVSEAPAQADNGRQAHLVHYLFDSLRCPSQHDRPARRPSPGPVLSRNGSRAATKASAASSNGCVCVACLVVHVLFFCAGCLSSSSNRAATELQQSKLYDTSTTTCTRAATELQQSCNRGSYTTRQPQHLQDRLKVRRRKLFKGL